MIDWTSNGRCKHFGYPIDGGVRGKHDSFTNCESCDVRLWKDTLMDTVHCPSCGVELVSNYSPATRGGVNSGETPMQRVDPKHPPRYDNSGRVRLFGGMFSAYQDGGDYSFSEFSDSLVDETF